MTYSVSGLIQATDYNTFAQGGDSPDPNTANVNTIWGVGSLDKGWGQSTPVTTVASAATVTATQWSTLFSRFTAIANQTGTSVTAIVNPTVGDTVAVKTNFSTNLSSCFTGRNNAAAVGSTITASGAATYSSAWAGSLTATHTITFADAASARYFFNAGGIITWGGARTGGSATAKNTSWSNLLTACGTINTTTGTSTQTIAGTPYTGTTKTGGSGTPTTLLTGTGFYDLTTGNQEVFKQFDSTYLYTTDFVSINIKANAAAGSATVITITVLYQNAVSGYDTPAGFETVDGTLTSTVTAIQPSLTYLSNTWGTPVLSSSIVVTTYPASYLVVGGGGGGGYDRGGGGGGGDVISGFAALTVGTTYSVSVGAGGTAGTAGAAGTAGSSSTGFGQTATGGGRGGSASGGGGLTAGGNGSSGGGGAGSGVTAGGTATAGFAGGAGITNTGGGGGGKAAIGGTGAAPAASGGAGLGSVISSAVIAYYGAGGGGGATLYGTIGGSGVGGAGGFSTTAGTAGTANTGSGGGGGGSSGAGLAAGAGGSGVAIMSVPTANYAGDVNVTGTYTKTTYGSNTVIKWTTGSGSYIA